MQIETANKLSSEQITEIANTTLLLIEERGETFAYLALNELLNKRSASFADADEIFMAIASEQFTHEWARRTQGDSNIKIKSDEWEYKEPLQKTADYFYKPKLDALAGNTPLSKTGYLEQYLRGLEKYKPLGIPHKPSKFTFLRETIIRFMDEIESSDKIEGFEKSLSTTQQVLALRYLLKYLQVKNVDKTTLARFIAVLHGGKNYKEIYDKTRDELLHATNNGDDAIKIGSLFELVGQPQITQMIETDLECIRLNRNKS